MCGIYGEFYFSNTIDLATSCKKMELLSHRGPDGFGLEYGNYMTGLSTIAHNSLNNDYDFDSHLKPCNYFLGHRRLSIIDLSDNAFQPMENITGKISIVFNGEIYNYIELKYELEELGCEFKTDHSDTEVLLNAYQVWGERCLDKLRGMFAFTIFDRHKKTLFFARDRIGKKPFYYEFDKNKFCFSSELGPLIKYDKTKRHIDEEALYQYLLFGYILHPHTIFQGIQKLSPAYFGIFDLSSRRLLLKKYWDISLAKDNTKLFNECMDEVDSFFHEAVSIRLRADVPVGAFISGGIDSTLVIKKIKEITQKQYDVFGADFPGTVRSEKKYIEEAAAYYNQHLHLSNIDLSYAKNINKIVAVFDEPFDGGSSVAVYDLFQTANKEKYKVILTGDGGDELFAGYERYQRFLQMNYLLKMFYLSPSLKKSLSDYLVNKNWHNQRAMHLLYSLSGDKVLSYIYKNYDFNLTKLLKKKNDITIHNMKTIKDIATKVKDENFSDIKTAQYFELKTILPGRMLYKIDRFSMVFGVEARAPMLDHKLVEYAFNLPDKHNINLRQTKRVLKKILSKDFSKSFVYRKKQGFGNPFDNWFQSQQSEVFFKTLQNKNSLIYNFLSYRAVHDLFPDITQGYTGWRAKQLWRLIVLGEYLENNREFINC